MTSISPLNDATLLKTQAFIDGEWVNAISGRPFPVTNPADNSVITEISHCDDQDALAMVDAAHKAQPQWAALTAKKRSKLLRCWHDLIIDNLDDLATILTMEQGKPLAEASSEILYGASYIEWFAEETKRIYGDIIAPPTPHSRLSVIKQPVGVVACITPWNFPNAMLTRKIAPALAAGCTVVCKPATSTPLSALALVELAHRAGIPDGVINIAAGDTHAIGKRFTTDPRIRKVTFTGSTTVGKKLMAACAEDVKRTSMELGGNAPVIIFEDADIHLAVKGVMAAKFRNAGQTCICANRVFVHSKIYDVFVEAFTQAVDTLTLGNGLNDGITIGPLIDQQAAHKVRSLVNDAIEKGAAVLNHNSTTHSDMEKTHPNFVAPVVLGNITSDMQIFREEIFGPVAPLIRFENEDDVILQANDTEFGLAAYFYTEDRSRIYRVAEQLQFGIIGINEAQVSNEMAPFGGIKHSGQGREGSHYGLDDYLDIKYLCHGGLDT